MGFRVHPPRLSCWAKHMYYELAFATQFIFRWLFKIQLKTPIGFFFFFSKEPGRCQLLGWPPKNTSSLHHLYSRWRHESRTGGSCYLCVPRADRGASSWSSLSWSDKVYRGTRRCIFFLFCISRGKTRLNDQRLVYNSDVSCNIELYVIYRNTKIFSFN